MYPLCFQLADGEKNIPPNVGRYAKQAPQSMTAIAWLGSFAEKFGEKLPDSNKIHLPMCVTKEAIFELMKEELEGCGEGKVVSESHFYKLWSSSLPHIRIPTVRLYHMGLNL